MIDQRRMSAASNMGSFQVSEDHSSDEGEVPEFGKYKNVPDIQVLIDFWTKEVE
jgi:hypothetical protein